MTCRFVCGPWPAPLLPPRVVGPWVFARLCPAWGSDEPSTHAAQALARASRGPLRTPPLPPWPSPPPRCTSLNRPPLPPAHLPTPASAPAHPGPGLQSVVKPQKTSSARAPLKKNPLRNLGALLKLNPYAKVRPAPPRRLAPPLSPPACPPWPPAAGAPPAFARPASRCRCVSF